jgi:hypothetical protein
MRTLTPAGDALLARILAGEKIPVVQLVRLDLTETIYLTTAGRPIVWGGHTWVPEQLGALEPISDVAGDVQGLQFSMAGVSDEQLAIALIEPVEGRSVVVYDALIDPDTGEVADAVRAWSGTLNVPGVEDGDVATVIVTAEHRGMRALRPKPSRYTNAEQQRRYPGDTSLDIDPATDAGPVPWPSAAYFKQ